MSVFMDPPKRGRPRLTTKFPEIVSVAQNLINQNGLEANLKQRYGN
jgi:hypothetical protein